jgi:transketolase
MLDINDRNIKTWSIIGSRAAFGMAALDIAKNNKNLIIVTADVSTSAGLDRFRKTLPEQYIDVGIAEQNMIGVAAGLASENYSVITTTFAPFQALRCCEQIKVNAGYMKQKICMVGLASGLVLGSLGFTHCCIEDIGVLRSIPGISIISPSDSLETIKALEAAIKHNESTYIRLTGGSNNPSVNLKDYNFQIGKGLVLKEGNDVVIFCNGHMVYQSLLAADLLQKENISAKVINMHTVKPIDKTLILDSKNAKLIVTVEEHNVIGGLGSAVAEVHMSEEKFPKQISLGINDRYSGGGTYNFMLEKYGLTSNKIAKKIKDSLN